MKIFTPHANLKVVEELTRYISPASIEKARFQKFNAPIVDDGNLVCDKFFRMDELFNKREDIVQSFHPYSIDDVPLVNRTGLMPSNIHRLSDCKAAHVENNLPYYVDIIGENKRMYLEDFGVKNPKYPTSETDAGVRYPGLSVDEVINIKYHAKAISPVDSLGIEKEAYALLKKGFPLEGVVNLIKKSAMKDADGNPKGAVGLLTFLAEFPDLKNHMVLYSKTQGEVFDRIGAKRFRKLYEMCDGDKKLACNILWDCRCERQDGSFLSDENLLDIGTMLYKTDNTWTSVKSDIIQCIKNKNSKEYNKYRKIVGSLLYDKTPMPDIVKILARNNKKA